MHKCRMFGCLRAPFMKSVLLLLCFSLGLLIRLKFPIDVGRGTMMHDFAITENYAIFLDLPIMLKTENFMKGKFPIVYDDTLGAR